MTCGCTVSKCCPVSVQVPLLSRPKTHNSAHNNHGPPCHDCLLRPRMHPLQLLVGCPGDVSGAGSVAVIFGTKSPRETSLLSLATLTTADGFSVVGSAPSAAVGASVASGNFNGDGAPDVAAGAPLLPSAAAAATSAVADDATPGGAVIVFPVIAVNPNGTAETAAPTSPLPTDASLCAGAGASCAVWSVCCSGSCFQGACAAPPPPLPPTPAPSAAPSPALTASPAVLGTRTFAPTAARAAAAFGYGAL